MRDLGKPALAAAVRVPAATRHGRQPLMVMPLPLPTLLLRSSGSCRGRLPSPRWPRLRVQASSDVLLGSASAACCALPRHERDSAQGRRAAGTNQDRLLIARPSPDAGTGVATSAFAAGSAAAQSPGDPPPEAAAAGLAMPPKGTGLGAAADAAVQHIAEEKGLKAAASAALHSIE